MIRQQDLRRDGSVTPLLWDVGGVYGVLLCYTVKTEMKKSNKISFVRRHKVLLLVHGGENEIKEEKRRRRRIYAWCAKDKQMVGRNTQTLICEQGSSQGSQEKDVISQLPDHLITDILYHLPTKEAVTTSVLSTRWTNLWKLVPGLDLDSPRSSDFKAMQSFADRFLDIQRESLIRKFKLKIHCPDYGNDATCVPLWIEAALTGHRIQHLDVHYGYYYQTGLVQIPLSVFTSGRLVHLRLFGAKLFNAEFFSLPCLKMIHLEYVTAPSEAAFEKLISSSPVLEDLTIRRCNDKGKVLKVRSKTVKRVHLKQSSQVLVIDDAPLLQFLRIKVRFIPSFKMIIYSWFSAKIDVHVYSWFSAKIDVHVDFGNTFNPYDSSRRRSIRDFLTVISSVRDLSLSRDIWEVMRRHLEVEQLPQFGLLSRLCVRLSASDLIWLPAFLKNFPKLKSLSLVVLYGRSYKKMPIDETSRISFPPVLECLSSSLEFLDIKARVSGDSTEMKLVTYFLENSLVLKKLTVRLGSHPRNDDISD
ncbi:unnamed protein product [Microthlaspi erraticum]|uniref:F-box domain-containing protein n=1 Tax=Microthlaspi erraticum TaxID=1685480 RepID=A0A6D2J5Y4_9BRAS|nr:unnamed protein product [Microthlaspi erraticum]